LSDLGGMLEAAMSDPRFAGILSSLKEKAESGEIDTSAMLSSLGAETAGGDKGATLQTQSPRVGMDSHRKLLAALKPYLGDTKRGAVDEILKISEFSGVIEALSKKNDGR